jgi:hypothetical protein
VITKHSVQPLQSGNVMTSMLFEAKGMEWIEVAIVKKGAVQGKLLPTPLPVYGSCMRKLALSSQQAAGCMKR